MGEKEKRAREGIYKRLKPRPIEHYKWVETNKTLPTVRHLLCIKNNNNKKQTNKKQNKTKTNKQTTTTKNSRPNRLILAIIIIVLPDPLDIFSLHWELVQRPFHHRFVYVIFTVEIYLSVSHLRLGYSLSLSLSLSLCFFFFFFSHTVSNSFSLIISRRLSRGLCS